MTHPTIHLNGTSKQQLVREYEAAYDDLNKAMDRFREITVHARDYYVQKEYPSSFDRAQREHSEMYKKLADVRRELEDKLNYILEQGKRDRG